MYLYGVNQESSKETAGEVVVEGAKEGWESTNYWSSLGQTLMETINANTFAEYVAGQNLSLPEPPNFIGVSLASLLPAIFTFLNYTIDRLRKFNKKKDEPTLAEVLEGWLDWFDEVVLEIDDLLYLVDQVVEFIEALLNSSFTYLRISTTKGIEDVVAQLEGASGFPNEDSSQVILGFVGVVGFPSPDDPALNLSEYFSEVSKEFNEEAADLLSDLKLQNEGEGLGFLNKILPNSNK